MSNDLKHKIFDVIQTMITEWELDFEDELNSEIKLIKDLDFSSIDFVELFVRIEDKFQRKLGFHNLIMQEAKYIDDLSIQQLINFVNNTNKMPVNIISQSNQEEVTLKQEIIPITSEQIKQFRRSIPEPPLRKNNPHQKNAPAIFILCPSRSGSTLLRVILAGNTNIFAPPELHLLSFENLGTRYQALDNDDNRHLLDGTTRAIMQAKNCGIQEAEKIMQECQEQNLSTKDFYQLLQGWIGEQILLDKTPSYAYHLNFLQAAEIEFDNALYIHLLRHPYGMIRSFQDAKMNQYIPFMRSQEFSSQQYAELAWLICQQNIVTFLEQIPASRQLQVKFEDLVVTPKAIIQKICQFLGVDFQAKMLNPYQDKHQRMTDGINNSSRMSGDLKFHLHHQIEPTIAYRWRKYHTADFLSCSTWELAKSFGYEAEI